MTRTQIYLPDDLHQDLRQLSTLTDKSVSALIRQATRKLVNQHKTTLSTTPQSKSKTNKYTLPTVKVKKKMPAVIDRDYIYEGLEKRTC